MAVDLSLACSLPLFIFALYVCFFLFRLDVVHTPPQLSASVRFDVESILLLRPNGVPAPPLLVLPLGFQIVVCSSWNAGW